MRKFKIVMIMRPAVIIGIIFFLQAAKARAALSSDFSILLVRTGESAPGLLNDSLFVNDVYFGIAFENADTLIAIGVYNGLLRYSSAHDFVQSPFNGIGKEGDFLIEIAGVHHADGAARTDVLFHGGNAPKNSAGCIMLGAVRRNASGVAILDDDALLRKLRLAFYGTDTPNSTPNKTITITIIDKRASN